MSALHQARVWARRLGVDVRRWPDPSDSGVRLATLLRSGRVSVVLDVGANSGQYAQRLRSHGYTGRIVSFEPLAGPVAVLARAAASDPRWTFVRCALGDSTAKVTMNVAANQGASSSVLAMLPTHALAAPEAGIVGQETVDQRRLDDVVRELGFADDEQVFVKVDVQGYERFVLDGATQTLARAVGVQLELSLVPLYDGGLLYREAIDLLGAAGFDLVRVEPVFWDPGTGADLQFDGVFMRRAV